MSDVETDSEGFESADDNEFESTQSKSKQTKNQSSKKVVEDKKAASDVEKKLSALDVNDQADDIDEDWEWDDDDDGGNFNFKPPTADDSQNAKPLSVKNVNEAVPTSQGPSSSKEEPKPVTTSEVKRSSTASTPSEPSRNSWTPWSGVVSLISSASGNVASFIESNIGVPDPEEFARKQREERERRSESEGGDSSEQKEEENQEKLLNLGSFVSNVTSISNRVISGGLDTLEGIGKKTMTILQENDPGLINKRKLLGLDNDRPILSQVLRDAKEKSEANEKNLKAAHRKEYRKQLHFEMLFDDYHGLVHLEALEMLSKQASLRLQSLLMPLTGQALNELQQTMNSVTELCELNELDQDEMPDTLYEVDELAEKFRTAVEDFDIDVDFKDILESWKSDRELLSGETELSANEVHDQALKSLAKASALAVNKYHKLAELLLVKDHHSTVNEADALIQLTNTFCWHLSGIATNFSNKITSVGSTSDKDSQTNALITNIFLENSKSTSYIQNAFQLFVPILQIGAV